MPKKFTIKPIHNPKKVNLSEKEQDEEIMSFYKGTEGYPIIQKPIRNSRIWIFVVLVSILFGFFSGLVYNFLFQPKTGINSAQRVFIDKQEKVTVTSEERLRELAKKINPVIVNFYDNSKEVRGPFYQDIYSFGTGFVLTSDGWIVTSQGVLDRIGERDYKILTADYKIYNAEKILKDPSSPIVFIKIKANDLEVAKLDNSLDLFSGQKVYSFLASYPHPRIATLHLANLQNSILKDVVASSEEFSHFISSQEGYDISLIGAPVVNLNGEIVAVVLDVNNAFPVAYFNNLISNLSKKNKIERTYLGVHYIDLANYPKIDPRVKETRNKGALLSGLGNLTAIIKNSPASKAGLRVGDIITMVEDELINSRKNLTQIIQDYNPGQTLKLTVLRGEKEKIIKVQLRSF